MTAVAQSFEILLTDYRRACLLRALIKWFLVATILAALVYLPQNRLISRPAGVTFTVVIFLIGTWVLWRRSRKRPQRAAVELDALAGLKQRLITAEHFAQADPQPALLPHLLKDVEDRLAEVHRQLPRRWDVQTTVLAVILALLLLLLASGGKLPLPQPPPLPAGQQSPDSNTPSPPERQTSSSPNDSRQPPDPERSSDDEQPQPDGDKPDDSQGDQSRDKNRSGQDESDKTGGSEGNNPGQGQDSTGSQNPESPPQADPQSSPEEAGDQGDAAQNFDGKPPRSGQAQTDAAQESEWREKIDEQMQELETQLEQIQAQLQRADNSYGDPSSFTDPQTMGNYDALGDLENRDFAIEFTADEGAAGERYSGDTGEATESMLTGSPEVPTGDTGLTSQTQRDTGTWKVTLPPDYQEVLEQMQDAQP